MEKMLVSLSGVIALLVTSVCAPGAVILDGNVDGGDSYAATLDDAIGEAPFESDSWDIQSVSCDMDESWLYVGVATVGMFDTDGGDTSFFDETLFIGLLGADQNTTYVFDVSYVSGVVEVTVDDMDLVEGVDFQQATDNDLEFTISLSLLPELTDSFAMQAQLDDTGVSPDDQISGQFVGVPEPMAFLTLAVGGLAVLYRRRR